MTSSRARRLWPWAAPVAVVGVVAGAALVPSAATASPHPNLPARTTAQLLADVQASSVTALSGTVVETARLGLPQLPDSMGDTTSGPMALATGSHTISVWFDGPQRQRVAIHSRLAEYDAVHSGRNLWTYTSANRTATHAVLPAAAGMAQSGPATPGGYASPQAAADAALAAVGKTTTVSVDRTARVANRPVYQIVLQPRDHRSLVGSVRIAIDSATKVPLRVQVWGAGSAKQPALEVGYTHVTFARPAASVFAFTPPAGAKVTQQRLPAETKKYTTAQHPQARIIGSGWTSVLELPDVALPTAGPSARALDKLTTAVPGGRMLKTTLLSILVTDRGRTFVGAVSPTQLQAVARAAK